MSWAGLKPAAAMLALAALALLALGALSAQGLGDGVVVPPPEDAAAQMIGALGAKRYTGARGALSEALREEMDDAGLRSLALRIEASPAGGIVNAHGVESQRQGGRAAAVVQVKLGSLREVRLQLPMVRERGLWKVDSLAPLEALTE